jgi:hypothetical protein
MVLLASHLKIRAKIIDQLGGSGVSTAASDISFKLILHIRKGAMSGQPLSMHFDELGIFNVHEPCLQDSHDWQCYYYRIILGGTLQSTVLPCQSEVIIHKYLG